MDIINKYLAIYKEEITNKVIEHLSPLFIQSLKYYGIYHIIQEYYNIMINTCIMLLLLFICKLITNTQTTANARAPLYILVLFNFLLEHIGYYCYYFLMLQAQSSLNLVKIILFLLLFI
jgi:hypothetical protein